MATRGIDIRQTADRILFRASLKDSTGAKVTSGTTELRVYRLEDDGTLDVLDWDSGTKDFVSSGATDDEVTMTHRQADGVDTGIWTYAITDATILAAFSLGQVYIVQVTNSGASPESQEREFQFGGVEGDQADSTTITVTVTPAATVLSTGQVSGDAIIGYQHAAQTIVFTVVDELGTAIDLSGKTVVFAAFLPATPTINSMVVDGVVSGASNNIVTIDVTSDDTENHGSFRYRLWNTTDKKILAENTYTIHEGPESEEETS